MFRGLRRVFSKGHSAEVESNEVDNQQQFDAPVVVRPRSKSSATASPAAEVTTCSAGEAPVRTSPTQGCVTAHTSSTASVGKTAWSVNDLGENAAPARVPGKSAASSPPAASTSILQQHSVASSAAPLPPQPPPPANSAWGVAPPSPEKTNVRSAAPAERESPPTKHHTGMRGLFRSGSKGARISTADDSTAVEPMGYPGNVGGGDVRRERGEDMDRSARGAASYGRCSKGSIVENIALDPMARGGALRAGALVATPQAL